MYSGELKVDEKLYRERLDRLVRLATLKVPKCVIQCAAILLASSFHDPLSDRWKRWLYHQPYEWLTWLLSADYRQLCRDNDAEADAAFEKEMKEILSKKEGKA